MERSKQISLLRAAFRALWLVLVPLLLAGVVLRHLFPSPGSVAADSAPAFLSRLRDDYFIPTLALLFLLFSVLLRYWRGLLPGGNQVLAPSTERWTLKRAGGVLLPIAAAVAGALLLRGTVEPLRVTGSSMRPTFEPGQYLLANKLAYGLKLPFLAKHIGGSYPKRGEVIVIRQDGPQGARGEFVKRVIGLPGDRVVMDPGGPVLTATTSSPVINGWAVPRCEVGPSFGLDQGKYVAGRLFVEFLGERPYLVLNYTGEATPHLEYTVKPGEIFVLGDHRDASIDSRNWIDGKVGGLSRDGILGRAEGVLFATQPAAAPLWSHVFDPLGAHFHFQGVDTRGLDAALRVCLNGKPKQTQPPAPSSDKMSSVR